MNEHVALEAKRPSALGPLLVGTIGAIALGVLRWPATATLFGNPQPPPGLPTRLWPRMFASLPWPFIVANVLFALGCVALVGVLTRNDPSRLRRLGLSTPQPNWSAVLWLCVVCVGLVALSVALTMRLEASGSLGGLTAPAITPYWPVQTSMGIAFAISMAPLAALGEELLYRGYVQRGLLERWSPAPGILLTALCSALGRGWPDLVYALPSTVFLGWAAYRTDSTRASFIIHVAGTGAESGSPPWPPAGSRATAGPSRGGT